MNRRRAYLAGLLVVVLALLAAWSYDWMNEQKQRAQQASVDLAGSRLLAASIQSLRQQPTIAAAEDMGIQQLGSLIEAALGKSQLKADALEGVIPQSTRRLGNSPYEVKPTSLVLREVTLGQLASFLYHLTQDTGLTVREMRIRAPHGDTSGNTWDAEATLTYLIYSPIPTRATNP